MATTLSPEKMAEFMVDEFMDDLDLFVHWVTQFEDRWTKIADQYHELLTPEKRAELEMRYKAVAEKIANLGEE